GNLFRRRVEGPFERIERKGTGPADFSWEVTDKNGIKRTYGAAASARLADARPGQAGNIFSWHLERVEDPFGNSMTVSYVLDTFPCGDTFTQISPRQIDSTGAPSLAPAYHVDLKLDDGGTRPDVTVSGRAGFPVATRRRLAEIDVRVGNTPVRSYGFEYDD